MPNLAMRIMERSREADILRKFLPCYHPTPFLILDDESMMVETITFGLMDKFSMLAFTDPKEALKILLENQKKHANDFQGIVEDNPSSQNIHLHLHKLKEIFYSADHFSKISVACVDYSMPKLSGIKFAERCKNYPVAKLLFTGKATLWKCIQASNAGTIDAFIHKNLPNRLQLIENMMHQFEELYFSRITHFIVHALMQKKGIDHYLFSDGYLDLIQKTFTGCGAVARCLLEESGSFLFITAEGEISALIIRDKLDIHTALKANQKAQHKAPEKLIEEISTGQQILYTGAENDLHISPDQWVKYSFPAEPLTFGDKKVYCAYITGKIPGIDTSRIVSYKSYLAKMQS